mgnify:CR=1 FL=1
MAKYILEQIKVEGALIELLSKSNGENVAVTYNGTEQTLTAALASIYTSLTNLPTGDGVDAKISAVIDELIGGAPAAYDTLKEIADYIAAHKEVSDALSAAIGGKVDKVAGKGLSTEDFTAALKSKLESMPAITSAQVTAWTNKAEKTVATASADGLMSKADKARLDGLRGVRYGATAPADMQDGEMFVRVAQ